jgi:hypothetical protein
LLMRKGGDMKFNVHQGSHTRGTRVLERVTVEEVLAYVEREHIDDPLGGDLAQALRAMQAPMAPGIRRLGSQPVKLIGSKATLHTIVRVE